MQRAAVQAFDTYAVAERSSRRSGRRLVTGLRTRSVDALLLALACTEAFEERVPMLEAGADDPIQERVAPEVLATLARTKLRSRLGAVGGYVIRVGPLALYVGRLYAGRRRVTMEGSSRPGALCIRWKEFAVLQTLAYDAGAVVPRTVLVDRVWGAGTYVSRDTLSETVRGLR